LPVVVGIGGVIVVLTSLHDIVDDVMKGVGKEWAPGEIPGCDELPDFNVWAECFLSGGERQGILLELSVCSHGVFLLAHTPGSPGFDVIVVDSADFCHQEVTQFPQDSHVLDSLELQRFERSVLPFLVRCQLSVELAVVSISAASAAYRGCFFRYTIFSTVLAA
jgi:hypothetical protein